MRILLMFLFLSGCVQVAPNLKLPEPVAKPCPNLDMPGIPETVNISINGKEVKIDAGGELLIRNYVKAQKLLK